jgi:hypothetical protein
MQCINHVKVGPVGDPATPVLKIVHAWVSSDVTSSDMDSYSSARPPIGSTPAATGARRNFAFALIVAPTPPRASALRIQGP